jgi:hypothetical protein
MATQTATPGVLSPVKKGLPLRHGLIASDMSLLASLAALSGLRVALPRRSTSWSSHLEVESKTATERVFVHNNREHRISTAGNRVQHKKKHKTNLQSRSNHTEKRSVWRDQLERENDSSRPKKELGRVYKTSPSNAGANDRT